MFPSEITAARASGMYRPPPNSRPLVDAPFNAFCPSVPIRFRTTSKPPWSTTAAPRACPGPPAQSAPQSETASSPICTNRLLTMKSKWSPCLTASVSWPIKNSRASSGSEGKPSAWTCSSLNATPLSRNWRDVSTGNTAVSQPPLGERTTSWPSMRNTSLEPAPGVGPPPDLRFASRTRKTVGSKCMPCSVHGLGLVPHTSHASSPPTHPLPCATPYASDDIAPVTTTRAGGYVMA